MASKQQLTHHQLESELANPSNRVRFFKGFEFRSVGENVLHSKEIRMPLREKMLASIAKEMV